MSYTLHKLEEMPGIFDDIVDCVFIITMDKSVERHKNIHDQLTKYNLCKNTQILFNKGFKIHGKYFTTFNESVRVENTSHDLFHANLFLFNEAITKNYNNILILEDDFILSTKLSEIEHIQNLTHFVHSKKNKNMILYLGIIPIISRKYNDLFFNPIIHMGTHAVIYNRHYLVNVMSHQDINKIYDIDLYNCNSMFTSKFLYKEPLVYQIFPETENKSNWGKITSNEFVNNIIHNTRSCLMKHNVVFPDLIKLGIDKSPEPGTSYLYKNHTILPI